MEKNYIGVFPTGTWHYKGTLAEIRATPGPEGSLGHPTDSRLELRYRNGAWEAMENGAVNLDTGAEAVNGMAYNPTTQATTFPGAVVAPSVTNSARSKVQSQFQAKGNIAYYRISGNVNDVSTAPANELYMIVVAAEDEFEGFATVFPPVVGGAAVTPTIYAVKPVGSLAEAEATTDISGWSQPSRSAQPNVADIAAVRANLHGVVYGPTWIRSVARSDGGTKPLLAIIIGYASGAARTLIKYTQTAGQLSGWRTGAGNGGRILAGNYKTGYSVAWNSGTNQSTFPILGVNFYYRKPVINLMRAGDSRPDGAGASVYTRDGCVVGQIDNIVSAHGGRIIVGDMNLSMPQQTNETTFPGLTQYLTSSGITPEAALVQLYSINSIATSEASTISAMSSTYQEYRSALIRKILAGGGRPIIYNTNPCATSAKDLTLSDYLRVENNARFAGIVDLDFAAHASGATVNGQVQPLAGSMAADLIHESDSEILWQGTQLLEKMRP